MEIIYDQVLIKQNTTSDLPDEPIYELRYEYTDCNFCAKFESNGNILKSQINDKFAILIRKSHHEIMAYILFFETLLRYHHICFFNRTSKLSIIKNIDSIEKFKYYIEITCYNSCCGSLCNFPILMKNIDLHSELWSVWYNEIQPAICCFFN